MLTNDEVQRIREEEALRFEIRTELARANASANVGSPLLKFLNSALGLWLLSALFITGGGALFSHLQQKNSEHVRTREVIERLDLEIEYRFSQIMLRLHSLTDQQDPLFRLAPERTVKDIEAALVLARESPLKSIAPLYPEFANMGLPSLMAELLRHTKERDQRQELAVAIAHITGSLVDERAPNDVKAQGAFVLSKLMLPRWKAGYFYFTDCPASKPFC